MLYKKSGTNWEPQKEWFIVLKYNPLVAEYIIHWRYIYQKVSVS